MTGAEFGLSIIASLIASILYEMSRNPTPPVFKDKSEDTFQESKALIRKFAAWMLPSKKEESARPVSLKKSADARARLTGIKHKVPLSLEGTCTLCNYIPLCPQQALKKS